MRAVSIVPALVCALALASTGAGAPPTTAAKADASFRRGVSLMKRGKLAAARKAFDEAAALGDARLPLLVREAVVNAKLGDTDKAFAWLAKAVEKGLPDGYMKKSPGLAPLKADPRFAKLLARAAVRSHPCAHDARYRQFDFWLGKWTVTANGRVAGRNHIVKTSGGCLLYESWQGAGGGVGHSMNHFDPADGRWHQLWVGTDGGYITARGGLEHGAMVLVGEHVLRTGESRPFRMTFTPLPDGSVRQYLEESRDGGKTWSVWFDGHYVRRK